MMRILVLSDLHLEHGVALTVPPGTEYDVVVLAGDVNSPGTRAVYWAARESTFGGKPVVYVPGNHEFYGCEMRAELEAMRAAAAGTAVHVLSQDTVVISGVRFVGATLWTDFMLPVAVNGKPARKEVDVARALQAANRYVNDFRAIEVMAPLKAPMNGEYRERGMRRVLRARRHAGDASHPPRLAATRTRSEASGPNRRCDAPCAASGVGRKAVRIRLGDASVCVGPSGFVLLQHRGDVRAGPLGPRTHAHLIRLPGRWMPRG